MERHTLISPASCWQTGGRIDEKWEDWEYCIFRSSSSGGKTRLLTLEVSTLPGENMTALWGYRRTVDFSYICTAPFSSFICGSRYVLLQSALKPKAKSTWSAPSKCYCSYFMQSFFCAETNWMIPDDDLQQVPLQSVLAHQAAFINGKIKTD